MKNRISQVAMGSILVLSWAGNARAATYRVMPSEDDVLPAETIQLRVDVVTEEGDNLIDTGFFSFAIDLTISGDAGVAGDDINNVAVNEADFDYSASVGLAQDSQYLGVAGVTADFTLPTFGHQQDDVTWLFDFELTIPETAQFYQTITITPSEGALENLIANASFDNVAPQNFQPATLTVVPEPTTGVLGLVLAGALLRRSRRRSPS